MKLPLIILLSSITSMANAAEIDSGAWSQFNTRMHEMLDTTGWHFNQAMDTKQIAQEWQSNQARAQIKFSNPGIYHGRISKVVVDNRGTYFIVDQGKSTAVTVHLENYQVWPWKTEKKPEIGGIQSAMEFASNFDANQEFYFQCRRVEFGLGIYLANCLAFPSVVAASKSSPELKNEIDPGVVFDEVIRARASESWSRPPSTRQNMSVILKIGMDANGTITSAEVEESSGDAPYDRSVVATIKNIGRLPEIQGMKASDIEKYRSFKMSFTPEDLAL
jgi:colicin import membrane protein